MMSRSKVWLLLVLLTLSTVGCSEQESTPSAPTVAQTNDNMVSRDTPKGLD